MLVWRFTTHHSPFIAHSSFLACNISSQKAQCGVTIKSPHCICSRTPLSLPTHRIAFFRSPLIFRSCWTRFCISLEPFLFFSADRSWNLRLSESRDMLAWTLPSVSKLNNVKQVQDDHQLCSVVFCYIEEQKRHIFEQWALNSERVGTSACSVRREHKSYNLTLSRKGLDIRT